MRLLPLSSSTEAAKARKSFTFIGYRRGSRAGSDSSPTKPAASRAGSQTSRRKLVLSSTPMLWV